MQGKHFRRVSGWAADDADFINKYDAVLDRHILTNSQHKNRTDENQHNKKRQPTVTGKSCKSWIFNQKHYDNQRDKKNI